MAQRPNPLLAGGPSASSPNSKHSRAYSADSVDRLPDPFGKAVPMSPLPPKIPISNVNTDTNNIEENSSKSSPFANPDSRMYNPPGSYKPEEDHISGAKVNSYSEDPPKVKLSWSRLEILLLLGYVILVIFALVVAGAPMLTIFYVHLWRWLLLTTLIIGGRVFSKILITLIISAINRNYISRDRIYFWKAIDQSLSNFFWFSAVWMMISILGFIIPTKQAESTQMVDKFVKSIFSALMVSTVLWIHKIISIEKYVVFLYRKRCFEKIKTALHTQHVMECLLRRPRNQRLVNLEPSFAAVVPRRRRKETKILVDRVTVRDWEDMHAENISPRRLTNFVKFIRYSRIVRLDKSLEQLSWSVPLQPGQTRCDKQAVIVSQQILLNVFRDAEVIQLSDLQCYMAPEFAATTDEDMRGSKKKKTDEDMQKPDSKTNNITKTDVKDWVVRAFNQRRALELSLLDIHALVNCVDFVLGYVVSTLMSIISLLIILDNTAAVILFAFVLSYVTVMSCFFNESANMKLKCLTFVFGRHNYDVGDTCEIDGRMMAVEQINLLDTIFINSDKDFVSHPNHVLLSKDIMARRL